MTVPSSDVIFAAASEPPKDDQQWVAARKSAVMLAESGTLLMTGARAKDSTTWKAGDDVYLTCETCHARYMDK